MRQTVAWLMAEGTREPTISAAAEEEEVTTWVQQTCFVNWTIVQQFQTIKHSDHIDVWLTVMGHN